MNLLHVHGADRVECLRTRHHHLPPWNHTGETDGDQEINEGYHDDRIDHSAWDDFRRLLHLVTEVTYLVITEEVEHHQHGSVAQAEYEGQSDRPGTGGKIKEQPGGQVRHAREDYPCGGNQHADPKHEHKPRDVLNLAIECHHGHRRDPRGQELHTPAIRDQFRPKEPGVFRHADAAGCDFECATEQELPDKNPRHHVAPALATEALTQEDVGAAGSRDRRT